jgi:hypothetical protein
MIISLFMEKAPQRCAHGRICAAARARPQGEPRGQHPRNNGEYQELHTLSR